MKIKYGSFHKTLAQIYSETVRSHGLQISKKAAEVFLACISEDESKGEETPKGSMEIITTATLRGSSSEKKFDALLAADTRFCPCTLKQALFAAVPKICKSKKTLSVAIWEGLPDGKDVFVLSVTSDKEQKVLLDIVHRSRLDQTTNYLVRHVSKN